MTFFESLKKWFYTKNSSAASSDARVPLLDASGNPKGSDTMANLASVLGGLFPNITNSNANNITTAGTYFFVGGGAPSDNGILNVTITGIYANGERRIVQHFAKVGVKHFYIRHGYIMQGESPVWNDWCELTIDMPTFYKDYNDIAALKTGLGLGCVINKQITGITTDTGISANGGQYGKTILVIYSDHNGSGDKTSSAIYMLRCGFDGNHVSASQIKEMHGDGVGTVSITFTVNSSTGNIVVDKTGSYTFISSK